MRMVTTTSEFYSHAFYQTEESFWALLHKRQPTRQKQAQSRSRRVNRCSPYHNNTNLDISSTKTIQQWSVWFCRGCLAPLPDITVPAENRGTSICGSGRWETFKCLCSFLCSAVGGCGLADNEMNQCAHRSWSIKQHTKTCSRSWSTLCVCVSEVSRVCDDAIALGIISGRALSAAVMSPLPHMCAWEYIYSDTIILK